MTIRRCIESARIIALVMLVLTLGPFLQASADEILASPAPEGPVASSSEMPVAESVKRANAAPQSRSDSTPVVRVVQPRSLFPFLKVRPPTRPSVAAGQIAHVDANGRLIPRPAGSAFPLPSARGRSAIPFAFRGTSSHGGIGVDASDVRAHMYATVNSDGKVSADCVQGDLEDVRKAIAADQVGVRHGHDHASKREAAKQ